jgi:hypothetical protein
VREGRVIRRLIMGDAKELTISSSGMKKIIVERGGFKTVTKMEKERANNALATQ